MDCKKALAETGGDMQKAIDYLSQKGWRRRRKRQAGLAADGAVGAYVHPGGKIGVLVEINCETDFVARTAEFQSLAERYRHAGSGGQSALCAARRSPADGV